MLVISRRRDEAVVIGRSIEVRVLRVGRDTVRLGISAPADVAVYRTEIYELICRENRAAADGPSSTLEIASRLQQRESPDRG